MNCKFDLCIFQRENECLSPGFSINSMGMCDEAMIVELDQELVNMYKEEQLQHSEHKEFKNR